MQNPAPVSAKSRRLVFADALACVGGCFLTLWIIVSLGAEPFYGHPGTQRLLWFVALPPAAAVAWLVRGWGFARGPRTGRAPHIPGSHSSPLGVTLSLLNAALLLFATYAYLSDVAAFGRILRDAGQ